MTIRRTVPAVSAALALSVAFLLTASTHANAGNNPLDVIVNFGDATMLTGNANQVVVPDEVTIAKDGTVTFVVYGGGHGIAIYPVSKDTTRDEIIAQLCAHDPVTGACIDPPMPPTFANADHTILDGKGNVIIATGTSSQFARVDDPTNRLLATSTQIGTAVGAFLTGTTATATGTQLQFQFDKPGRYLVICMNRTHFLSNWMFGFVNVDGNGSGD